MKNKIFLIIFFFIIFHNQSLSEPLRFESAEIEIKENGNKVIAKNGKAITQNDSIEIEAANFEYSKTSKVLKAFNGSAFLKLDNIKIDFDSLIYDEKNFIISANDNVKIFDFKKDLTITTDLIIFDQKKKI